MLRLPLRRDAAAIQVDYTDILLPAATRSRGLSTAGVGRTLLAVSVSAGTDLLFVLSCILAYDILGRDVRMSVQPTHSWAAPMHADAPTRVPPGSALSREVAARNNAQPQRKSMGVPPSGCARVAL